MMHSNKRTRSRRIGASIVVLAFLAAILAYVSGSPGPVSAQPSCPIPSVSDNTISGGSSDCQYVVSSLTNGGEKCEGLGPITCRNRSEGSHKVDMWTADWVPAGGETLTVGPTNPGSNGGREMIGSNCTHARDGIQNSAESRRLFTEVCNSDWKYNGQFRCPYAGGFKCQGPPDQNGGGGDPGDNGGQPYNGDFAPVRNPNAEPDGLFNQQQGVESANLNVNALSFDTDVPETARKSGSASGEANFRVSCQYSHFAKDDPILNERDPGGSHLHMFFGNTTVDAFTDLDGDQIEDSGGGSCNGFALNRSAYWVPALLDGEGNAMVPYQILAYYKTKKVNVEGGIQPMPQGLKMVAGNPDKDSFTLNYPDGTGEEDVFWSCGGSGSPSNGDYRTTIPTDCGNQPINATIRFPQCLRPGVLTSINPKRPTHTQRLDDGARQDCGSEFDRMPELSVLLYWKQPANRAEVVDWRLSSDKADTRFPGGTLHADWIGGWKDSVMDDFIDHCLTDVSNDSSIPNNDPSYPTGLNCGYGNLGNGKQLDGINPDEWQGPYRVRKADLPG